MAVKYIIKVYADAVIAGTRTFKSIPEKSQSAVYDELADRVKDGQITEEQFDTLVSK